MSESIHTDPNPSAAHVPFPYQISDLLYWILVRKDGTTIKFVYQDAPQSGSSRLPATIHSPSHSGAYHTAGSVSRWCQHAPSPAKPLYTSLKGWTVSVADMAGVKEVAPKFNLVIDCGDVLDVWKPPVTVPSRKRWNEDLPILEGDPKLTKALNQYVIVPAPASAPVPVPPPYRLLKIDWADRCAPDLHPDFWTHLYPLLSGVGSVVTNCQGGHGRSGSTACILMMLDAPDYTPLDAIVHLRANHCPRAIESLAQHNYLNLIAEHLGREQNAHKAASITDYKGAFAASQAPTALRHKKALAGS